MLKITCEGVYYKNGGFVPAKDGPAAGLPAPEKAREGTMAHAILKAHNTGDNMEELAIRFDAMASHDITYVGIIQTARASGMQAFPLPYVLTNCHNSLVKYHGYQSDMKHFYAMADCVVLPSYHEGMSNVLLEAAASGRPLITSDIPGCREAVEPGVSGYLCPARDADALYAAMRQFLGLPPAQRAAMGCRGRERMERQFGKTAVVAETIKHLEI